MTFVTKENTSMALAPLTGYSLVRCAASLTCLL